MILIKISERNFKDQKLQVKAGMLWMTDFDNVAPGVSFQLKNIGIKDLYISVEQGKSKKSIRRA